MPFWSVSPEPRPSSSLLAPARSPMPALTAPSSDRAASEAPSSGSSDDPISVPSVSPRFPSTAPRMQSYQGISRSAILPPPRPGQQPHSTPNKIMQQSSLAAQSPALAAPESTTRKHKESGVAKGTGPELSPSARRDRPTVTYNLKELTYKSRSPSKPSSSKKESGPNSAISMLSPRPSRSSTGTPPIYNLKDLIGQTTVSKATHRAAKKFMKKWNKEQASLRQSSKRPAQAGQDDDDNDDGDDDDDDEQQQENQQFHQQQQPKRQKTAHDTHVAASLQQRASAVSGPTSSNAAPDNASKLIAYLAPILRNRGVTDPYAVLKLDWFKDFLSLPQQRTIQWNLNSRASTWSYRHKIDLSSLLIQITGESPPQPCERCASGGGLYEGCFVISSKIKPGSIYGCANCLYNGRQTFCSLKEWGKQRSGHTPVAALDTAGIDWTPQAPAANGNGSWASLQGSTASYNAPANQTRETLTPVPYQYQQGEIAQQDAQSAYASPQATSLAAAGMSTTSMRSMEPWEKAPGRIRSRASGKPESKLVPNSPSVVTWS